MIILALLAGMAVPRFASAIAHHRVDAAAVRIVRDLELARARAKASSASQTVTFDIAADSYQMTGVQSLAHSDESYVVSLRREPYRAGIGTADFDGDAEVVFDGYGLPDSGGTVVIQSGNCLKTVVLDPDTGVASVLDADVVGAGD